MADARGEALKALIEWYVEAGVDLAIDETPHDRFQPPPARTESPRHPEARAAGAQRTAADRTAGPAPGFRAVAMAPDAAVHEARQRAASAATLDELRALLEGFDGCGLKTTASRLVFADGAPGARVMFVGEAPGAEEDREGVPFVGRSGRLLDRMLAAVGMKRSEVYIANVIPWRPPGNRTPTPQETAICLPFVERQIALAAPEILVCLGGPAAQTLLGQREGVMRLRGRWFERPAGDRTIAALATLHPAYLLRQPGQKRLAYRDMLALKARLDGRPV
jgi:uracil-DNA glycosylase